MTRAEAGCCAKSPDGEHDWLETTYLGPVEVFEWLCGRCGIQAVEVPGDAEPSHRPHGATVQ